MIVAMWEDASDDQIQEVTNHLVKMGFAVHRTTGARQSVLAAVGKRIDFDTRELEVLPGVQAVHRISAPYKLAGRSWRPDGTKVRLANGVEVGGKEVVVMAGPCSVESREQIMTAAEQVCKAGAKVLRGGAFKPRSSPYTFQGLGLDALKLLREAGDRHGLMVISEVMEISQIEPMLAYVDIFQVGARNMQNFNLLRELGKVRKPVLLKRGIAATIEELLLSAEYVMSGGNYNVILVRARHPYLRDLHTQHARYLGDSNRAQAIASADYFGPIARNWFARQSCAHGVRIGGSRSGCAADRGASVAGRGAVGRRAVAVSGSVRRIDGSAANDCARSGTDDWVMQRHGSAALQRRDA